MIPEKEDRAMDKKEELIELLEGSDDYISGSELAAKLDVTRASVWKYIRSLEDEGLRIDAVTNRGYRLAPESDHLSRRAVEAQLGELGGVISVEVLPECTSTNTVLKERASRLPAWHTVISARQSAGRGRLGRSFYSPEGAGLYMSVLLRPTLSPAETTLITTAAAVAVAMAIEELSGKEAQIKWVNDVLVDGKKVCGILTEAALDVESGCVEYAVLGVGINLTEPDGGFPAELRNIVGAVFDAPRRNMRAAMAASFLRRFHGLYEGISSRAFVEEYRKRCFLVGRRVNVLLHGTSTPAEVLSLDDSCRLLVRYDDGNEELLASGEVSVRCKEAENE